LRCIFWLRLCRAKFFMVKLLFLILYILSIPVKTIGCGYAALSLFHGSTFCNKRLKSRFLYIY
ncbi:MAG: hypothetical protein WCI51_22305, partial [Lentisphaerota bacterium]